MGNTKKSLYLECGQIINTHGCRGGLKVDPWTDSPEDFCALARVFLGEGEGKREMKLLRASVMQGRFVLLELEGVTDMDAADALRGRILYAAREDFDLEAGQYFLSDAIGLPVLDTREGRVGQVLGTVGEILPGAAAPVYSVITPHGNVLVPGVPAFIKEVVPGECVRMAPIDGMFDDGAVVLTPEANEPTENRTQPGKGARRQRPSERRPQNPNGQKA